MVVEDEILKYIEEVFLLADASERRRQFYVSRFLFCQTLSLVEELPFRVDGAHACFQSVAE